MAAAPVFKKYVLGNISKILDNTVDHRLKLYEIQRTIIDISIFRLAPISYKKTFNKESIDAKRVYADERHLNCNKPFSKTHCVFDCNSIVFHQYKLIACRVIRSKTHIMPYC